jgi:hypothetical protein
VLTETPQPLRVELPAPISAETPIGPFHPLSEAHRKS